MLLLILTPLPPVDEELPLTGGSLAFVECPLPLIGFQFTFVGTPFASVGDRLTVVGGLFPLLKQSLPLIQQGFAPLVSALCGLVSSTLIKLWLLLALQVPIPCYVDLPARESSFCCTSNHNTDGDFVTDGELITVRQFSSLDGCLLTYVPLSDPVSVTRNRSVSCCSSACHPETLQSSSTTRSCTRRWLLLRPRRGHRQHQLVKIRRIRS